MTAPSPQVEGGGDAPASADANATSQTVEHPLAKLGAHIKTNDQDDVIGVTFFNHRTTNAELVHLKSLINLRALNLGRSRVTDAGLVHLKGLANLQELGLSLTITDAGLTHLQGLAKLQALNLGRSRVSDAGLLHLKGLTKLQALNASGARQITDKGIFHLKQLTGLRQLKLNGTQLTDAGLAQTQRADQPAGTRAQQYPGYRRGVGCVSRVWENWRDLFLAAPKSPMWGLLTSGVWSISESSP